jgi:hypothetical protein
MWIGVTTFIMVMLCVWFYHAPLEAHADPNITPIGTTAPWYFLWIQGALKLGDKTFWGVIFPTIYLVFLMVMPYLDTTRSRRFAHRRFALSVCFVFISATTILSYMGLPEYGVATAPEQHVLHEMVKEPAHSEMGALLPVPYEELAVGAYTTVQLEAEAHGESATDALATFNDELNNAIFVSSTTGAQETKAEMLEGLLFSAHAINLNAPRFAPVPAGADELHYAMEKFYHLLEEEHDHLLNAWGGVIVSENQDGLKRIDVVISWDQVELTETGAAQLDENGEPIPVLAEDGTPIRLWTSDYIFVHENASYFRKN